MSNADRIRNGTSPIEKSHLSVINEELGNIVTTVACGRRWATLAAKTHKALGALIGVIWNMWTHRGVSFDKVTVMVKDMQLTISIADIPQRNRVDIEFL